MNILKTVFQRNDKYEGVRRINIYLLRLLYVLMFFVLGKETWTHNPNASRTMGPDHRRGLVRVDGLRNFGGHRNYSSGEDAADRSAGNILQSALAYSCGVSSVVDGYVGRFTSGNHHLVVLVGDIAHRCSSLGIRVGELFLQAEANRSCSLNRVFSFIWKT
jgi:hypothetical protein